jgi:hypothetical protein
MYTIDDLNVRLLSELKEIAEGMGVKNAKKLSKQDLVYKILDQQAVAGEAAPAQKKSAGSEAEPERKMRPRRRENVAPSAPKTETELSSEELLESINVDFDSPAAKFEDKEESSYGNSNNSYEGNNSSEGENESNAYEAPARAKLLLVKAAINVKVVNIARTAVTNVRLSNPAQTYAISMVPFPMKVHWRSCRTDMVSSALLITTTLQVLMIFMFHLRRSNCSA